MSKLLDKILSRENMLEAYNQVKSNKGSAGVDGITIEEMDNYLRQNWRLKNRENISLNQFSE